MSDTTLLVLIGLPCAWALCASRFDNTALTGPLLMTVAGVALGSGGIGVVDLDVSAGAVNDVLTLTLVLVLFSDAAHIDIDALRRQRGLPVRLLTIGLPLTVIAGTLAGRLVLPDAGVAALVVLAVALAPTDAALGLAVIDNQRVPQPVRQGLNVESGLNDGVAVPLFLIAITVAEGADSTLLGGVVTIIELVGIALVVGATVGVAAHVLLVASERSGWSSREWRAVATPLFAVIAFALAELAGGSGFVAAFGAGAVLAGRARDRVEEWTVGGEAVGHLLTLVSFLIFGAAVIGPTLDEVTSAMVIYAVVSLTVVRMLPVALALLGSGFARPSVAFVGWFGPRGLASVIFAAELVEEAEFDGARTVAQVIALTVALSAVAHGVSAAPLAARYADWVESRRDLVAERAETGEVRTRRRLRPAPGPTGDLLHG